MTMHAEHSDLISYIDSWRTELGLHVAFERHDDGYLVDDGDHAVEFLPDGIFRVSLSPTPFNLEATSGKELIASVYSILTVVPGARTDQCLRESRILAAMNEDTVKPWRSAIRRLKGSIHKGATLINGNGLGKWHQPSHYYTDAALEAARKGVQMKATAGENRFEFDEL
jgi:hypothetical protein